MDASGLVVESIVPEREPLHFTPWGGQHKKLGIPKEDLPEVDDQDANIFHCCVNRYRSVIGICDPRQIGIPKQTLEDDTRLVAHLIAREQATDVSIARSLIAHSVAAHRAHRESTDGDVQDFDEVAHDDYIILEFIHNLTEESRLKIATYLYINFCDEVAVGLMTFDEPKQEIQAFYEWVLEFKAPGMNS